MSRKLRSLRVEKLRPPSDAKVNAVLVGRLVESIKHEGLREPLVVVRGGHIVHGVHRYHAAKRLGLEEIECIIEPPSGSPEEYEARVAAENVVRHHMTAQESCAKLADLVRLRRILLGASQKRQGRGRPRGGEREAIRQVAAETGRHPEYVKTAVRRAKEQVDAESPIVDERGQEIPEALIPRWNLHRDAVEAIGRHFRGIQLALGKIEKDSGDDWSREKFACQRMWGRIKVRAPYAICAWCRGKQRDECKSCKGMGFQSKVEQSNTPKEMLPL